MDYYGFIDPERARRQEELEKRKQAKLLEQQLDKSNKLTTIGGVEDAGEDVEDDNEGAAAAIGDSNISGFDDDSAMGGGLPTAGKTRFDTLLKSLIARIEFNGTLAPIQEYGRHQ